MLAAGDGPLRLDEHGQLHLTPLAAETVDPAVLAERDRLLARLPTVPLTEVLIEVDRETGFTSHLTHAADAQPRHGEVEHRRNLYAAILAQSCNLGATRMSELSDISADTIDWTTRWYLREETLRPGNTAIVDTHHRHPLAGAWGGGTLSSSDGLRLPMRGKSLTARSLSRYFLDEGVTQYTHVSDQHSTYGTQIIVSTERDATYVLDEILGNTTELPILEHATDSHGQTLATFALFDLVGRRLSPRIAKLTDKRLWRPHPADHYRRWPTAESLLAHHAQTDLIAEYWDDLLRIGGSLLDGYVSAALLITRLQAGSPTTPPREGVARTRQTAAHRARPALVHRRNVPTPHRAPTQPWRSPQRPAPIHLLRQPRPNSRPPPRRPDNPSPLPHPGRQRLHPVHHQLPPRRR